LLLLIWLASTSCAESTHVIDVSDLLEGDGKVAIQSWLVAGPFPSPDLPTRSPRGPKRAGYDTDFLTSIGGEAAARPAPGTTVPNPDGGEVVFQLESWGSPNTDLTDIFGKLSYASAYIYAEVESDRDTSAYLHIGTDDAAKVWVGGMQVMSYPLDRTARPSQNVVRVRFSRGRMPILLKIDQAGGGWGGYVECSPTAVVRHSRQDRWGEIPPDVKYLIWLFAILSLGWIPIYLWLKYKRERTLDRQRYDVRMAAVGKGLAPADDAPANDSAASTGMRRTRMLVWGLVLVLMGAAMTITEVAGAGFGQAGFELTVTFAGAGLLVASKHLDSFERNHAGAASHKADNLR